MEIKRKINGTEVVITLTDKELNKAYHEQKDILDANEVRDVLQKLRLGEILDYCNFPYPSFHYLQDSKIKEAEAKIMEQEDLMLDIYDEFGDFMAENIGNYGTNMEDACEKILKQFGEAHPYFLKAYETIDVIAYKKYQQDWIKNHNFSNTFMSEIQQEYLEYKAEYYPHSVYTFQEYLDNYGFHGNCYASINEFRNIEYQDAVYMNSLLTEEEYSQYLMDVSEYMWHDIVSVNGKISAEKFPISGKMDDDCYQIDDFLEAVAKNTEQTRVISKHI